MKALIAILVIGGCATDELAQKQSALATCSINKLVVLPASGDTIVVVPDGCTNVEIKAWGAAGSYGALNGCGIGGNGGGGGFVHSVEPVTPLESLRVLAGAGGGNHTQVAHANGQIMVVAGAGGGGGCKAFPEDTAGNGGAGGGFVRGEDGTGAQTVPPRGGLAGGGFGGEKTLGGEGGSSTDSRHGFRGDRFAGGFSLSGWGGSGFYGGGGGGTIFYAGAGGGGGSSFAGNGFSLGGAGTAPGGLGDADYRGYAVGGTAQAPAGGGAVVLQFGGGLELTAPESLEWDQLGVAEATAGFDLYSWGFFASRGGVAFNTAGSLATYRSSTPGNDIRLRVVALLQGHLYLATASTHVRDFDIQPTDPFEPFIADVSRLGVMDGCGGGNFCSGTAGTRGAIAEWLVKAKLTRGYPPRPATGMFADVPKIDPRAVWVEELVARGVTAGCAPAPPNGKPSYCPEAEVTRAQTAVFLLRMLEGPAYQPPAATGMFADVPAASGFAPWVEEIARRHITGGCGFDPVGHPLFCPNASVTRGQIAVFLVTTFGL